MVVFKKLKNILLVLSAFTLIFGCLTPGVSAATTKEPKSNNTLLSGEESKKYIKLANDSNVYKEKVSTKKIKNAQAMLFKADENSNVPEDAVVVSGAVGGKETDSVQIFISLADQKVVKVSHLKATGLEDQDTFSLKAYDENGNLRAKSEGTIEDMTNGKVTVEEVEVPQDSKVMSAQKIDDRSLWWACQFSSFLVCMGAAGVNILLGLACRAADRKSVV